MNNNHKLTGISAGFLYKLPKYLLIYTVPVLP